MSMLSRKVVFLDIELIPYWRGADDPTVIAMNRSKYRSTAIKDAVRGHNRKPAQLVLVRHAQSFQNIQNKERTEGSDLPPNEHVPITPRGISQAIAGGELYKDLQLGPPDAIYTSGIMRTKMTLAYFAHAAGIGPEIPVIENLALNEIDWGIEDAVPDRSLEEVFSCFEQYNQRRNDDRFYRAHFMGESQWDHHLRVRLFLDSILRNRTGQKLLVIAHSETIRQIIANIWMNEWTQYRDFNRSVGIENVSMIHIAPDEENIWQLKGWNPKIKDMGFFNDPFPNLTMKDIFERFNIP